MGKGIAQRNALLTMQEQTYWRNCCDPLYEYLKRR